MIFSQSIMEALAQTKLIDGKKRKDDEPKKTTDLEIKLKKKKANLIEYYELLQYWNEIKERKWIKEKMEQLEIEIGQL